MIQARLHTAILQTYHLWIYNIRIYVAENTEDKAISKSYKYLHLTPVDNSSFIFFSFKVIAVFSRPFTPIFLANLYNYFKSILSRYRESSSAKIRPARPISPIQIANPGVSISNHKSTSL